MGRRTFKIIKVGKEEEKKNAAKNRVGYGIIED